MRTTLILSDPAYELARSLAYAQRRSLGEVISELILRPKTGGGGLSGPNELGIYTFASPEPLTVDSVRALLEQE